MGKIDFTQCRKTTSAIHEHGRKIRYYDFLRECGDKECISSLLKIVRRIDIEKINSFISSVPYLSEIQCEFYQTYIRARLEKLLLPIYGQALRLI